MCSSLSTLSVIPLPPSYGFKGCLLNELCLGYRSNYCQGKRPFDKQAVGNPLNVSRAYSIDLGKNHLLRCQQFFVI